MRLFPVKKPEPGYPGFRPGKKIIESLTLFLKVKITIPVCVGLVLSCTSISAQTSNNSDLFRLVKLQRISQSEPQEERKICRGSIADDPAPPPCRGIVSPDPHPPPCRGDIALPEPPPKPIQITSYREVTLENFYHNARNYLGMKLRIRGILRRMRNSVLPESGFYLFHPDSANNLGNLYGCPLVGVFDGKRDGDRVVAEGTVVRRECPPSDNEVPDKIYAVQIESLRDDY